MKNMKPLSFPGPPLFLLFSSFLLFLPASQLWSRLPGRLACSFPSNKHNVVLERHWGRCTGFHILYKEKVINHLSVMWDGHLPFCFLLPYCCCKQTGILHPSCGSPKDELQWCPGLMVRIRRPGPTAGLPCFSPRSHSFSGTENFMNFLREWNYLSYVEMIWKAHRTVQVSVVITPMMFI